MRAFDLTSLGGGRLAAFLLTFDAEERGLLLFESLPEGLVEPGFAAIFFSFFGGIYEVIACTWGLKKRLGDGDSRPSHATREIGR